MCRELVPPLPKGGADFSPCTHNSGKVRFCALQKEDVFLSPPLERLVEEWTILDLRRGIRTRLASMIGDAPEARECAAYIDGLQTFIIGYPIVDMYQRRQSFGFINQFRHRRHLVRPTDVTVVCPNTDTVYSNAWLDLSQGPVTLHVPETDDRYYTFQFMDFHTNTFAMVGKRTTGTKEGELVILPDRWDGAVPEGIPQVRSPTNAVWLLGRILVHDPGDLPNVHRLQDQCILTPWKSGDRAAGATPPLYDEEDPLAFFAMLHAALRENPLPDQDAALRELLNRVGVGDGEPFESRERDGATMRGLMRAIQEGKELIANGRSLVGTEAHGWSSPPKNIGHFGTQYLFRAEAAMKLPAALPPEEAMYFETSCDERGQPLCGEHSYVLHLDCPPVQEFWSVTLYGAAERLLIENPLHRYAVSDRTQGLTRGVDHSVTIRIQHTSPGGGADANWLPAPRGNFTLIFRAYAPQPSLLDGTWQPPPVQQFLPS